MSDSYTARRAITLHRTHEEVPLFEEDLPFDPDVDDDAAQMIAPARPLHLRPRALALVFAGGVIGTAMRYGIEIAIPQVIQGWPVATFSINLLGAFVLGVLLENMARRGADAGVRQRIRLLAGTGFCGAFTTYSTFALEAVLLTRDGHLPIALAYGVSTVFLGALAAWAGIVVGASMHVDRSAR
ncbi:MULTISPECIES: fluoride efflux transporter CrcB [unclassified Rhodococcus (in: high G+C Gram-positive bacteria)]|uniref:fluoride efflux transporter CrcB n=1 Tax=unclassified Rhodococcus (in: high G+C Gram-positive bacteria) TaxID=192944 RepID=UPI003390EA0C